MIKPLDCASLVDQKVRVYRNLHNGLMSVQIFTPKGWRVAGHTADLDLKDVFFHVSQSGRNGVVKTGRKTVHAFIVGIVTEFHEYDHSEMLEIKYNPMKDAQFHTLNFDIHAADFCSIRGCKVAVSW